MSTSFLYVLKDAHSNAIKIGKANDWNARLTQLPDAIDLSESYLIECADEKIVFQLERSLHLLFDEARFEKTHQGTGYTEWFHSHILVDVLKFLETSQPFWKYTIQKAPVKPPNERVSPSKPKPRRQDTDTLFYHNQATMIQEAVSILHELTQYGGIWNNTVFHYIIPYELSDTIFDRMKALVYLEKNATCTAIKALLTGQTQCDIDIGLECELSFNEEYVSALQKGFYDMQIASTTELRSI